MTASVGRNRLAPHESSVIHVYMDTRRFTGPKSKAIFISVLRANDGSEVRLQVSANSREDIVCNPCQVQFGTVPSGQTPSRTVDVEYAGKAAWQVTKVTTPARAPFDATFKELYRRPGEVGYQVTVTLKVDAAPGPFREHVFLETNDPNAARLAVLVEGELSK